MKLLAFSVLVLQDSKVEERKEFDSGFGYSARISSHRQAGVVCGEAG